MVGVGHGYWIGKGWRNILVSFRHFLEEKMAHGSFKASEENIFGGKEMCTIDFMDKVHGEVKGSSLVTSTYNFT